jgi:hypothetical protein
MARTYRHTFITELKADFDRGHPGRGAIPDNPHRRGKKWKQWHVGDACLPRKLKREWKRERARAERRMLKVA